MCAGWRSRSSRVAWRSPWCTRGRRHRRALRGARPSGRRRRSNGEGQTPRANVRDQQLRRGEGSDPLWQPMPTEILMPALSPTMEEGKLAKWLVKEGQTIKAGDIIAEIETDKATMEVEASDEGKLGKILVAEGTEGVKVNTPIATLLAEGESEGAAAPAAKAPAPKAPSPQPPDQARGKLSPPKGEGARAVSAAPARATSTATGSVMQQARPSPTARPPTPNPSPQGGGESRVASGGADKAPAAKGHGRIFASPLARRLARELGVDVGMLRGSGPRGRIIRRDVDAALKDGGAQLLAKAGTAVAAMPSGGMQALAQPMPDDKILALYEKGSYDVVPHDGM